MSEQEPGWYAVIRCWDASEGMFPGAAFWAGHRWHGDAGAIALRSPRKLSSHEEAVDWAYTHDLDYGGSTEDWVEVRDA